MAVASLKVGLVCENYMLVIEDEDLDAAAQKLKQKGFREAPWSYGSRDDPALYTDPKMKRIHRLMAQEYASLDQNSLRFRFPTDKQAKARVVLLPSSYAHISTKSTPEDRFTHKDNIFYPEAPLLLESFVRKIVKEPEMSQWTSNLEMWAITYLYGELMLDDGVLDSCDDEEARAWFKENIQGEEGGMDKITCTKRLRKAGYDERLARQR
ncbi:hypothetical protein LCI18_014277 [Fusarium solani-melongenae]|uniref:Uncharacterized protein n=1 Tax=Fusarium solani subsp. cucurbitae TaxID=2747967 RepID=A0ACD3ZQE8_FUSSC|nr:hypothetical protein LCI18_014277 [Fusarium solani-melongenae]